MKLLLALSLCLPFVFPQTDKAQDGAKPKEPTKQEIIDAQLPSYPLTTCPVSDEALEEGAVDHVVDGRLVRLCCKMCVKKVDEDATKALAKVDAAVIKAQKASYPLEVCPVSGEKLGSMGDAIDVVTGTRLVRVCCKGCIKTVHKDPSAALVKVNAALIEAQKKDYPLKACPISGEELGSMGDPIDVLYGTTLVRLCCKGCVKGFHKEPKKHVDALVVARAAKK